MLEDLRIRNGLKLSAYDVGQLNEKFDLVVHYSARYFSNREASCLWEAFSSAIASCLRYPSGGIENFDKFDDSTISGMLAGHEDSEKY